jgi:hypothetical protein
MYVQHLCMYLGRSPSSSRGLDPKGCRGVQLLRSFVGWVDTGKPAGLLGRKQGEGRGEASKLFGGDAARVWRRGVDLICNAQRRVSTRPSHAPASSRHVECTRSLISWMQYAYAVCDACGDAWSPAWSRARAAGEDVGWPRVCRVCVCGGSITQESAMGGAPGSPRMGCNRREVPRPTTENTREHHYRSLFHNRQPKIERQPIDDQGLPIPHKLTHPEGSKSQLSHNGVCVCVTVHGAGRGTRDLSPSRSPYLPNTPYT